MSDRRQQIFPALLALLAASATAACASERAPEPGCRPAHASYAPALTGPYCVGSALFVRIDSARAEPFTRDPDDRRAISLTLHYPVAAGSQAEPAPYGDRQTWGLTFGKLLPEGVFSQAVRGERMADVPGGAPLVLYSPGFEFGLSSTNTFMLHDLVSHGYVVAAVDHPYVSLAARLEAGRIARFGEDLLAVAMPEDASTDGDVYAFPVVVDDLVFAIAEVRALSRSEPLLHDGVDAEKVGALGHSYGGAAAAELVRRGVVSGAIDYDGRFHAALLEHGVAGPLLLVSVPGRITAREPPNDNYGYREGLATARPGYYAEVDHAVHGSFQADVPWLAARAPTRPTEAALEPTRALALFGALNHGYFDVVLRGADETEFVERSQLEAGLAFGRSR